jgi:hypothetical protein
LRADIKAAIRLLEEALRQKNGESQVNNEGASSNESTVSSKKSVLVRLSKLELRKFDRKIERWQEFWDSFKSSVDENPDLSEVDKSHKHCNNFSRIYIENVLKFTSC